MSFVASRRGVPDERAAVSPAMPAVGPIAEKSSLGNLMWIDAPEISPMFGVAKTSQSVRIHDFVEPYLSWVTTLKDPSKCCVVLDIDGTCITETDDGVVLVHRPSLAIKDCCVRLGIEVVLVTARPNSSQNRAVTVRQLDRSAFPPDHYRALIMQPEKDWSTPGNNPSLFKYEMRRRLRDKAGKDVVLNIGDKWTDLMLIRPEDTQPEADFRRENRKMRRTDPERADERADRREYVNSIRKLPADFIYAIKLIDDPAWLSIKLPDEYPEPCDEDSGSDSDR